MRSFVALCSFQIVLLSGFCLGTGSVASPEELQLLEPIDTSSPRATLYGFIDTLNQAYTLSTMEGRTLANRAQRKAQAEKVIRCLDMQDISDFSRLNAGREATVCLKEVLDRIPIPPAEEIPGTTEDLPQRWRLPYTEIVLVHQDTGSRSGEYLFSQETVARAVEFYQRTRHLPYRSDGPSVSPGFAHWYRDSPGSPILAELVRSLPDWARHRYYGHALWQWIGLLTLGISGLIMMVLVYSIGHMRARRFRSLNILRYSLTLTFPIIAMLIPIAINRIARNQLVIHGPVLTALGFIMGIALLLAIVISRSMWARAWLPWP